MRKFNLKKAVFALAALLMAAALFSQADTVKAGITVEKIPGLSEDFIRGADVSMLAQIEKNGGKFYDDNGKAADLFNILKSHGVNWIRLRVWNEAKNRWDVIVGGKKLSAKGQPCGGGNNDLETAIALGKRAKAAGMKLLIDFHYSDFWADPQKQVKPAMWGKLTGKALEEAVEQWTKDSVAALIKAGARPDMVQTGNELNGGMLWPDGKTWKGERETSVGGMEGFINLEKAAIRGVRSAQGKEKIKVVIHLADGGDNGLYKNTFDAFKSAGVDYDVIGMSFYPYWHGSLDDLSANMNDMAGRYGKEVIVAETAYAFTPKDGDEQGNNWILYSDDKYSYLPTVQGQASWTRDLMNAVSKVKGGLGKGVFYWEPDWIVAKNSGWRTGEGNNWENQAMFDFDGKALPSLAVWNLVYGRGEISNAWGGSAKSVAQGSSRPYSNEAVKATAQAGNPPKLPATVKVIYSNDAAVAESVKWDDRDWKKEKAGMTVVATGTAASGQKVKAEVEISSHLNLIDDPSWEKGKLGAWTLNGDGAACYVENNGNNARTGKWTYKYWKATPFKSILYRTFTGIPNGNYTFKLWAMGGGGENSIMIFARDFGGNAMATKIVNTGWKQWKQYEVKNIPVSAGKVTIGIMLDTNSDNWGNFDDLEFYQE